ncbi:MAG: response regulator [Verrucomicrobiota bacterium]
MAQPPTTGKEPPLPVAPDLRDRDQRLDSLKLLAGKLAHDFNNFLAPIFGYLTLIKEEASPQSHVHEYATSMETSARRTEKLVDTLLLIARPRRQFHPVPTDFRGLVQQALERWLAALPDTAQIQLKQDLHPCSRIVDPAQWNIVLDQLLSNARFALATGGTLEISLAPETLTPARAAELGVTSTDVFRLVVRDSGFGMGEETRRRAFDPFFTTRPKGQALGLGLSLVHSVTRLQGGQVTLESAPDAGATVTLWLPPEPLDYQPASETAPSAAAPFKRTGGRKVLLVDDDPMVREVLKTCLQHAQLEVHAAIDGVEGLKLFQRYAKDLGIVISDLTMPNMNGVELVREIYKTHPDMPILLISGAANESIEAALAELGARAPKLMKKPFALRDLVNEVRARLG